MPNVHTVLKEEIARVARKEIKIATDKLKQDNSALKKSVGSLKKTGRVPGAGGREIEQGHGEGHCGPAQAG